MNRQMFSSLNICKLFKGLSDYSLLRSFFEPEQGKTEDSDRSLLVFSSIHDTEKII
jgi:hypothetical protein